MIISSLSPCWCICSSTLLGSCHPWLVKDAVVISSNHIADDTRHDSLESPGYRAGALHLAARHYDPSSKRKAAMCSSQGTGVLPSRGSLIITYVHYSTVFDTLTFASMHCIPRPSCSQHAQRALRPTPQPLAQAPTIDIMRTTLPTINTPTAPSVRQGYSPDKAANNPQPEDHPDHATARAGVR